MEAGRTFTVFHISPSYKPAYCYGGPTMSVAQLCQELSLSGLHVEILTTKANGATELMVITDHQYTIDGVSVRYYPRITKDHTHFSPRLLYKLYSCIKQAKSADHKALIHVHSWWNLVAISSTVMAVYFKIPVIVSPRGMITSYTLSYKHTFIKRLLHQFVGLRLLKCVALHATSSYEAENIKRQIKLAKITVIPNLVDLPKTVQLGHSTGGVQKFNLQQERITAGAETPFKLIFLSRIDRKKGIDLLFESLAKVGFPWHLSIAGDGAPEYILELKHLSCTLKINSKVRWLGYLENEHKFNTLQKHDLLVLISWNENFANVIMESLAVGTPVLVSDKVGLSSYLSESGLGWVCKTETEDLGQTLTQSYKDVEKRRSIRQKAPEQILKDFDKQKIVQEYLNLYQTLMKNSPT